MVDEERNRIKTAQREGIQIAKEKGIYTGKKRSTMQLQQVRIKLFMMK
jgi:DNA invertase Pin-like site-specific DNA recombinase